MLSSCRFSGLIPKMSQEIIKKIENKYSKSKVAAFKVGDTVEVETIIREGDKQRIQKFKGLVISIKGSGTRKMFTVRKISYGIGVEKKFPVHSTNVAKITVLKSGNVSRSKLYYLRDRVGKMAMKVRQGAPVVVEEHTEEAMPENIEVELTPEVSAENAEVVAEVAPEAPVETPAETTEEGK